jgi:hypothetical protein
MGEGENETIISTPLLEREVCHASRRKHMGGEFKLSVELGKYEMEGIMLDLVSVVNIFPKKSWEFMGKPKLMWFPIQLRIENKYRIQK